MKRLSSLVLVFLTGCATIAHGPNETIHVESQPTGAQATIRCDGGVNASGTTPADLEIPRRADGCVLHVSKDGAQKSVPLIQGWSGWYWSNFVTASAFPLGIIAAFSYGDDAATALLTVGAAGGLGFVVDHFSRSKHGRESNDIIVDLGAKP